MLVVVVRFCLNLNVHRTVFRFLLAFRFFVVVFSVNAFNVEETASLTNWGCFGKFLKLISHKPVWSPQTRFSFLKFRSRSAQKVLFIIFFRNFFMLANIELTDLAEAWPKLYIFALVLYNFSINIFDGCCTKTWFPYKAWLLTRTAEEKEIVSFCVDWRSAQNAFSAFLMGLHEDELLGGSDGLSFSDLLFLSFQFLQLLFLLFEFFFNFSSWDSNLEIFRLFGLLFNLIFFDVF